MKILVTGGAGYIGSHAVKELLSAGYKDILVLDNLENGNKEAVLAPAKLKVVDLRDREKTIEAVTSYQPDVVMHFAAYADAAASVKEKERYFENNVEAGINLLDAMVEVGVEKIVFSSSAAVYGNTSEVPITESASQDPTNPYGESKLHFEGVLSEYYKERGVSSVSLRYFNVAGADPEGELGNNKKEKKDVVSVLLDCAKSQGEFTVNGSDYNTKDGTAVRDYIHVTDLARAHVDALEYLSDNVGAEAFNLGSESGFTIRELIAVVKKVAKSDFLVGNGPKREGDIAVSVASSLRAKKVLSWQPKYSDLGTIVKTAWEWENRRV